MNRVTCYKLLYALGVTDAELERDYRLEHKAASHSTYFMPGPSLLRFRADAAIFNLIINNFYSIPTMADLIQAVDSLRPQISCLRFINRGRLLESSTVLEAAQAVVVEHNMLCRKAYQELELAIPYFAFEQVVNLPDVNGQRMAQLAFIASKTERLYGLQFPGKDVLGVAIGAMFQSDLALRDRLALLTGSRMENLADRSQMGSAVDAFIQSAFVQSDVFTVFKRVLYYPGRPKNGNPMELLLLELGERFPSLELIQLVDPSQFGVIPAVLSPDTQWVSEQAPQHPYTQFYVPLPIESKFYKPWKNRQVPNIFLVNRKAT